MIFSKADNTEDLRICTLLGYQIEQVPHYTYLGIWIHNKLSFKNHIEKLAKNVKTTD